MNRAKKSRLMIWSICLGNSMRLLLYDSPVSRKSNDMWMDRRWMNLPRPVESFEAPLLMMCLRLNRMAMEKRTVTMALMPPATSCGLWVSNQLLTSVALVANVEMAPWMLSLSTEGAERRTGVVSAGGVSCVSIGGAGCAVDSVVSCNGFVSMVLGVSGIFR